MSGYKLLIITFVAVLSALGQGSFWGPGAVDDIGGMHENPGYLGLGHGMETMFFGRFSDDSLTTVDILSNHGFLANFGGFATGYEHIGSVYRWTLGAGLGDNTFGMGYLRTWSASDVWGGGWKNGWIFGAVARPWSFVSAGWAYENTPAIPGAHRFGLGLRPASWRVTVFGDVTKPNDIDWENIYWGAGGELHIIDGIRLFGRYDYLGEEDGGSAIDQISAGLRIDNPFGGTGATFITDPSDKWNEYTVYSIASYKKLRSIIPMPQHALKLELCGNYDERPRKGLFASGGKSFSTLLRLLEDAAEDSEINGLIIRWRYPSLNFAQAEELRNTLAKFRDNDKPIYLYADMLGNLSYYLASAADYVAISPTGGGVNIIGLRAEMTYFKGTLDKIGVTADFVTAGDYKSAAEMITRTEPSEFAAKNMNEILDAYERVFIDGIAESRNMDFEEVKAIIDNGPYSDIEAESLGLVDTLVYWNEFEDFIKEEKDLKAEPIGIYAMREDRQMQWGEPERIAVIVVDGSIVHGKGGSGGLFGGISSGDREIVAAIDAARTNNSVKGIMLRVDSGGGSAVASDLIAHALMRAAEKKPVAVSMGGAAASGGYYISAPADRIYADRSTMTGSIGVVAGKISLAGLYDKIGISKTTFERGKNSGIYSPSDTFSVQERQRMESSITRMYDLFKGKVSSGRDISVDSVEVIAQGRVWAGSDALDIGLVDTQGGFIDALEYLIEEGDVDRDDMEIWTWPSTGLNFVNELMNSVKSNIPFIDRAPDIPKFPYQDGEPLYLMPYTIEVK